ncbi:MAG: hypothetical protein LLF76_05825 [Planctomycetaceae bacterium]|nr:hypothetical protein [Planctomycetaceae bacterium]
MRKGCTYKRATWLGLILNVLLLFLLLIIGYHIYPQFLYELDSVYHNYPQDYTVRTYFSESGKSFFEIMKHRKRLYSESSVGRFTVESAYHDLTGDARADLVICNYHGGAHGDSDYLVFAVNGTVARIDTIRGLLAVELKDLNNDGIFECVGLDPTFSYFQGCSFTDSPLPTVILSYDIIQKRFVPNGGFMSKTPLSDNDLNGMISKFRSDVAWQRQSPPAELLMTVVEFIYENNECQAWKLYDAAWILDSEAAEEYKLAITNALQKSPFYKSLIAPAAN